MIARLLATLPLFATAAATAMTLSLVSYPVHAKSNDKQRACVKELQLLNAKLIALQDHPPAPPPRNASKDALASYNATLKKWKKQRSYLNHQIKSQQGKC